MKGTAKHECFRKGWMKEQCGTKDSRSKVRPAYLADFTTMAGTVRRKREEDGCARRRRPVYDHGDVRRRSFVLYLENADHREYNRVRLITFASLLKILPKTNSMSYIYKFLEQILEQYFSKLFIFKSSSNSF